MFIICFVLSVQVSACTILVNILTTDLIIAKALADRFVARVVRRNKEEVCSMDAVQLSVSLVFGPVAVCGNGLLFKCTTLSQT